jgi:uncharacterized protein
MRAAFDVIAANLPSRSFLPALIDRANLSIPHRRTCGVGNNYLVFDPRGGVADCQMKIRYPVDSTYSPDPLGTLQRDSSNLQNLPVQSKIPCCDCEWSAWCTGGCPLETYRATGRYNAKSPNCIIYKALFPDVLKLEGLRLLKYAEQETVIVE